MSAIINQTMSIDPLTAANTLATIVQLVGMFKQESKDGKNIEHQEFLEWLQYHRHDEIKNLICNTAAIQTEVINLLRQDNATILAKLDAINGTIALLVSRIDSFQGLSKSLMPTGELSDQAVSILRQLVVSNCRTFVFVEEPIHAFFEENRRLLNIAEPVFFPDDLDTLERHGLIARQSGGIDYTRIYGITRAGAKFVNAISPQTNAPI
jgi:hypothetical protein